MNKQSKIVMIAMFRNEAHTIGRMLESCYRYIDYYVIQNNGSTDGTEKVVEDFFKDKNIPGFVYIVKEGWVGFGWNRDHLLQTCLKSDHGCDWILKMDCDEILEVDENFNWSIFNNKDVQSFHVPVIKGGTIYNRAWIWNAKLPWKFNHDTAHETITLDLNGIGENFQRINLPKSFRHRSFDDGQSWQVPTKFLSDALKLEEKMIRENTLLSDIYHFWYIGKSYYDAYKIGQFPLKSHAEEYARRCIWYFKEFLNTTHDYENTKTAKKIDEMAYYACILISHAYRFLKNDNESVQWLKNADPFCPRRNEHWVNLAEIYRHHHEWEAVYDILKFITTDERLNPFPNYMFIIDNNCYKDTGNYLDKMFNLVKEKINLPVEEKKLQTFMIKINQQRKKRIFVVDDFYENPDEIRDFALSVPYKRDINWYKGLRSEVCYRPENLKQIFESIIGEKIIKFEEHGFNGCFQITNAEDPQVYHHDSQRWAGMIYLTPNAPIKSGTRLHRSLISGARHADEPEIKTAFDGGFYDATKFDVIDDIGNIYNRLIIMDARCIHSAGQYFGKQQVDGRLIHLFFFD